MHAQSTHWVKYVPQAVSCHLLALIGCALMGLSIMIRDASMSIAWIVALLGLTLFLFAHHRWFHKLLSEHMVDMILTSERVIYFDDVLFFSDNEHEIPLHRVAGVEVKQEGLLRNILDYGTIWIDTGGSSVDLKRSMPNVHRPEEFAQKIARLAHTELSHVQQS